MRIAAIKKGFQLVFGEIVAFLFFSNFPQIRFISGAYYQFPPCLNYPPPLLETLLAAANHFLISWLHRIAAGLSYAVPTKVTLILWSRLSLF